MLGGPGQSRQLRVHAGLGLGLATQTGQGTGGPQEPLCPEAPQTWAWVSCRCGATSPFRGLGFRCDLVGPYRCAGEVIGCPQPRPARAQKGKKGVTSGYSEVVVAPQKSQSGARPLAARPPCLWEPGGCRSEEQGARPSPVSGGRGPRPALSPLPLASVSPVPGDLGGSPLRIQYPLGPGERAFVCGLSLGWGESCFSPWRTHPGPWLEGYPRLRWGL